MKFVILSALILIMFLSMSKNKINGLIVLLFTFVINFKTLFHVDIETEIKIIFLFLSFYYMIIYGIKRKCFSWLYLIFSTIVLCSLYKADYTSSYNSWSAIKSSMSFYLGANLFLINFKEKEKEKIIKTLIFLPIISALLGPIVYGSGVFNSASRFKGGNTVTNLAFMCVVSIIACVYGYNKSRNDKYIKIAFMNTAICLLTLTRGGILSCLIMLLPFTINYLKKVTKKKLFFISISLVAVSIVIALVGSKLFGRMYTSGVLNSSGRFEAWEYIVNLNGNRLFGEGYGKLTTLTLVGKYIDHFNAAHNEIVRSYYETGIVGTCGLVFTFVGLFTYMFKNKTVPTKYLICIILLFSLYSLVDNTISNYVFWLPFMLIINVYCDNNNNMKYLRFKGL